MYYQGHNRHFFTTTGLVISEGDNNLDEYWEGDELRYLCKDGELGTDASADNFKTYKCKRYALLMSTIRKVLSRLS